MTQVKYNDQKWWVLLNGEWIEIAEKDWEKVRILVYTKEWENNLVKLYPDWKQNEHQIYSLPNEVEFEIKMICNACGSGNDGTTCPVDLMSCKWLNDSDAKQVAHLKEGEPTYNGKECKNGCNCIQIAESNNGGNPIKTGYQCLKPDANIDKLKEKPNDFNKLKEFLVERSEEVKKDAITKRWTFLIDESGNAKIIEPSKDSQSEIDKQIELNSLKLNYQFVCEERGKLQSEIESLRANLEDSIKERDEIVLQAGERIKELESKLATSVSLESVKDIANKSKLPIQYLHKIQEIIKISSPLETRATINCIRALCDEFFKTLKQSNYE